MYDKSTSRVYSLLTRGRDRRVMTLEGARAGMDAGSRTLQTTQP